MEIDVAIIQTVDAVRTGSKSAFSFVNTKLVVKATRRGKFRKSSTHDEILLSIGKPNYAERALIRHADRNNEDLAKLYTKLK